MNEPNECKVCNGAHGSGEACPVSSKYFGVPVVAHQVYRPDLTNEVTADDVKSAIEKPPISFSDERGYIKNLLNRPCGGVQLIFTRAGSKRSSHWHREDGHVLFVLEGMMIYWERPVGSTEPPTKLIVMRGEQVYTGPNVEHWTHFPVDTQLVSMSDKARDHESHEADLVRVGWFE